MKTDKINIQLMEEGQLNKELIFNEAMIKIDSLTNIVIEDFSHELDIKNDNSFIILDGENKNKISYKNINSDKRQYFIPNEKFLVFVINHNSFYIFNFGNWEKLSFDSTNYNSTKDCYLNVSGELYIDSKSSKITYLYLTGDVEIRIDTNYAEFNLIIKQNNSNTYNVKWGNNILWPKKKEYSANKIKNSIDLIRFFKLEQENYYLATYNTDYQY